MREFPRVDNCPIDIYIASNMPFEYPYKIGKPEHIKKSVRDSCETFIMDSGIGDDVSNEEVLDLACEYEADIIVPKDYLHDQERTTESVHEFMDLYEDHECTAMPMVPLQPPHDVHYLSMPESAAYMIGGVKDWSATKTIEAVKDFRKSIGYSPYLHLLGSGASREIIEAVAEDPELVQSLDCSTPEMCAINGKIFDVTLKQRSYELPSGKNSSLSRYGLAQHLSLILNDAYAFAEPESAETTPLENF